MLNLAEYAQIFLALVVIVNPVGAVPMFVSMTAENRELEKKHIARIASIAVAVVLVMAAVIGQPLLAFFGITIASFKVGGAISTTIIYATERSSFGHLGVIILCCLLAAIATWIALRVAPPVSHCWGKTGVKIAIRLMGLLLAAVSVEIMTRGLVVLLPALR